MRAVVAVDRTYGIGKDGQLQHYVSADLKRFKQITSGGVVIYGRKTLETFPGRKALPGRINVMLTRNRDLTLPGIETAASLDALFDLLDGLRRKGMTDDKIFVIGGAEIYEQLLPYTDEVLMTRFAEQYEADRHFPNLADDARFVLLEAGEWQTEGAISYRYETWRQTVADLSVKPSLKRDRLALARLNPADVLSGTIKARQAVLEQFVAVEDRRIFLLSEAGRVVGYVLFANAPPGTDAATAVLHSSRSLTAEAMKQLLTALFDSRAGQYSLLLSADPRVPAATDDLPGLRALALPGVNKNRVLLIASRTEYSRFSVAFFPFELGLVALESDGHALTGTAFLEYGSKTADARFTLTLQAHGLTDSAGTLKRGATAPFTSASRPDAVLGSALAWLEAYFSGAELPEPPPLSRQQLPAFMSRVIDTLKTIPFGEHLTYGELAAELVGKENAARYARAVGQACAANPHALFVPCHRVIGNKGELVGFSGGIRIKDYLLNHELVTRIGRSGLHES